MSQQGGGKQQMTPSTLGPRHPWAGRLSRRLIGPERAGEERSPDVVRQVTDMARRVPPPYPQDGMGTDQPNQHARTTTYRNHGRRRFGTEPIHCECV